MQVELSDIPLDFLSLEDTKSKKSKSRRGKGLLQSRRRNDRFIRDNDDGTDTDTDNDGDDESTPLK